MAAREPAPHKKEGRPFRIGLGTNHNFLLLVVVAVMAALAK